MSSLASDGIMVPRIGVTDRFLGSTKIHGLRHLQSSFPRFHRLFWAVAFMACLGLLLAWSIDHLCFLLSYPTEIEVNMIWSRELKFPAVTLCRLQQLKGAHLNPHISAKSGLHHLLHTSYRPNGHAPQGMSSLRERDINDILVECVYRGDNCTREDFTPFVSQTIPTTH